MKTLVLYGDSLFGRCRKGEEQMLSVALQGKYEIYNCATGGWDTDDLIRKTPFINTLNPDVFIVSIGTNDASPWKQVPLERFEKNLVSVLSKMQRSNIIFFPPPPVTESLRPAGKEMSNSQMKKYHDLSVEVCKKLGIKFIDSWSVFSALQDEGKAYHLEDGVHLNEYGYQTLFQLVKDQLNES